MKLYDDYSPTVSVILPTYNRERLLPRAVNSVLKQTFEKWELIIVDDGSEDNTYEYVNKLISNDKRIKCVKQQNMKLPIALNNGIALSFGKYVTFLGSDDEYLPEHLELRVKILEENPDVDFLHGGVKIIGNPYVPDKNDITKKIHLDKCVIGGTFFAKREVFIKLNGFRNIFYSEDSEFFERAEKIFTIRKVGFKTYVYHRDTENGICNDILEKQQQ